MKEGIIAAALIFLLVLIANPLHVWMPMMMQMLILVALLAAFSGFSIFVLRERAQDEREIIHRMQVGRIGFLVGASVLTIAIIVQELYDALDPWLVFALVGMILGKILAGLYVDRNN